MSLVKCPECQKEISDTARSCPHCGYLFPKMKFCKFCGEKIPYDSVVCVKCGRQVENIGSSKEGITINNGATSSSSASAAATTQVVTPSIDKKTQKEINKTVALILCIFLGYFGAHKFYEGKTGMGILYLFTVGLCGIGWVIDIIIIAMKPDPYYV